MSLRAALLGLLAEGPATGYELTREFDIAQSGVIWPAPKGELYRELANLQRQGFAEPDAEEGARRSRTWRITSKGRAELKRWLKGESDYSLRYEPMLRAVFLTTLEPDEILARLAADRAFFAAELARLKQLKATPPTAKKSRRRFGLPLVMNFYEAMIAWSDAAAKLARKNAD